jgi:uncharacterized damage-inducible protein DinB
LINTVNDYARYNLWANKRLQSMLDEDKEDNWNEHINSSFGSLAATIHHIYWAEYLWFHRIAESKSFSLPANEPPFSKNELLRIFVDQSEKLFKLVGSFRDNDIHKDISYKTITSGNFESKKHDMILHCINHSTFHRGQIVHMMRFFGCENFLPLDYIFFKREEQ